jgi:hypothetical protein
MIQMTSNMLAEQNDNDWSILAIIDRIESYEIDYNQLWCLHSKLIIVDPR